MTKAEKANRILSWTSTTGTERSLIIVEDASKDANDIEQRRIELCSFDSEKKEWKTDEMFDYIEEIHDFGIPETFLD